MAEGRHLRIETPEAVALTYPLAGLGSRGLAAFIDVAMIGLLVIGEALAVGVVLLLAGELFGNPALAVFVWAGAAWIVMAFMTYWGYYIFGEVVRNGRTMGKRIMKVRVVRDDGGRISMLASVVRNIVRIIDIMPGTYAVGIIASTLSPRAQRLGDMAAGTVVVAEPEGDLLLDWGAGDERAGLVGAYLRRRAEMTADARYQVGVSLLSAYGESAGAWDEPTIAGRLVDLAGVREQ